MAGNDQKGMKEGQKVEYHVIALVQTNILFCEIKKYKGLGERKKDKK